jgi:hypothetical protein
MAVVAAWISGSGATISGDYQTVAIRKASTTSASASAMQTNCTGASSRLAAVKEVFLAATGAAAGLRIFTPSRCGGDNKGPGIAEAFAARQ